MKKIAIEVGMAGTTENTKTDELYTLYISHHTFSTRSKMRMYPVGWGPRADFMV